MRRLTDHQRKVALEADDFIKDITSGRVQINEPEVAPARPGEYDQELNRQAGIAEVLGIGRTQADSDRVYDLLRLGKDAPYGVREGRDMQGLGYLGIDGDYKSDSTIRLHRNNLEAADPLIDSSVVNSNLIDGYHGLTTEYLSDKTASELQKKSGKSIAGFNRLAGEYYGQQALKLSGATPVADVDRSDNVVNNPKHRNSTLGTDRLIETNRSFLGQDVGAPAGDYRYIDPDGYLLVDDYQVATYGRRDRDVPIKLQMAKESTLKPSDTRRFAGELQKSAQGRKSIDTALGLLLDAGVLPPLHRKSYKHGDFVPKGGYTRAGKMTSDGNRMGVLNKPIEDGGQHRYQNVLFGIQDQNTLGQIGGAVPKGFAQVDTRKARGYLADLANKGLLEREVRIGTDGSIYTNTPLQHLLNAGVATDMAKTAPLVRQLL